MTCDPSANPTSQYSSEESAEPGNGFWMPPNLTGIIYAILCARSSTICYGSSIDLSQGILLVHPHRQGMTASDEKPNQDKEAAKA